MFELRLLHQHRDLEAACALFADVWHLAPSDSPINVEVLRALVHNDNYLCGAFLDEVLVGGSVAFWGRDDQGWLLHSHITGVRQESMGNGVGYAVKQHQRQWTLDRGVARITWTFDPLIRRNAYFNLARLGAVAVEYHEAFYGEMRDPINNGDESDRCVAVWNLHSNPNVSTNAVPVDQNSVAFCTTILDRDGGGWPVEKPGGIGSDAALLRAYVPSDIELLRATEMSKALAWRRSLRATFGEALHNGYFAETMTRDGWYTLRRAY